MVKYFGDAHHGQLMLQESNEVSFGGPTVGLMLMVTFVWLLIGSFMLCWKVYSMEKMDKSLKAMIDRRDGAIMLPATSMTLTVDKHAHRILIVPQASGGLVYTLPKPKPGIWFKFYITGSGSVGGDVEINSGDVLFNGGCGGASGATSSTGTKPDGTDDNRLIATTPSHLDVFAYALDTKIWHISGISTIGGIAFG